MAVFNDKVKDFRLKIGQSNEAMAMMLNISVDKYLDLETDWLPEETFLKDMCALFKWNFNEIKLLVSNTSSTSSNLIANGTNSELKKINSQKDVLNTNNATTDLGSQLKAKRIAVGQTVHAISMMLAVPEEVYQKIETEGVIPNDELLRKICSLFELNYKTVKQKFINTSSTFIKVGAPVQSLQEYKSSVKPTQNILASAHLQNNRLTKPIKDTLGKRLKAAREQVGQTMQGVSLLLDVNEQYYQSLEEGVLPESELLLKIATLFRWNYNEIQLLVKNENIQSFQPKVTALNQLKPVSYNKFTQIQKDIGALFQNASSQKQEMALTQLEMVLNGLK